MHEKAERATLLVDLGSHTVRDCETAWNLPQNWGHDSLYKSHNFLRPLRKRRFFWTELPPLLYLGCDYGFQEYKAVTKSDFMVCCSEIIRLQKGKDSAGRECWQTLLPVCLGSRKPLSVWVGWCSPGAWSWGERCIYKGGITQWAGTVVCLKMYVQGTQTCVHDSLIQSQLSIFRALCVFFSTNLRLPCQIPYHG